MQQQMHQCLIHDKNTHYWVYHPEKTPVIVAIHGFRGTHHGLEFIARHIQHAQFIIPDVPGFGASAPLDDHSIQSYSDWLVTFVKHLNLPEPPIILGHSFGSLIVTHTLASHPSLAAKAIFINPISMHKSTLMNRAGQQLTTALYTIGRVLPEPISRRVLSNKILDDGMSYLLTRSADRSLKKIIKQQHRAHFGKYHNKTQVQATYRTSINNDMVHHAHKITSPSLLIVGEQDQIVPLATQHKLHAAMPNATLRTIPQVGHLIHYEKPQVAAKLIDDFVS